jgi:hypothetical protein
MARFLNYASVLPRGAGAFRPFGRGRDLFQNEVWNDGGRWVDSDELEPLFGSSAWRDTGFWRDQSAVA